VSAGSASARPLIVAHRGVWGEFPQNSLPALQAAIDAGCEMAELDVRRTKDGRLVAVHDARVRGTLVSALDHAELTRRLAPGQAPLLAEMVQLAHGRIRLDVELKEAGYARDVLESLTGLDPAQYVLTSFLDEALAEVRACAAQARAGLLVGPGRGRRLEARLAACGASFIGAHAGLARAGLLAWAANRGLESYVWTVNERRALRSLLSDPRVAGVITDRPALALRIRSELQR
jgi:glycerophosphoryl diester phosphodiesterase